MFTEMIKCEFKQLQKPLKLVSTIIAIMTVTAFVYKINILNLRYKEYVSNNIVVYN